MILQYCHLFISIGMLLTLYRLCKGPHLLDRIAAMDLLSFQALCWIAVTAYGQQSSRILDLGLTLTLVTFFSTLGLSTLMHHRPQLFSGENHDKHD